MRYCGRNAFPPSRPERVFLCGWLEFKHISHETQSKYKVVSCFQSNPRELPPR